MSGTLVVLQGEISREATPRTLPSGDELVELLVRVREAGSTSSFSVTCTPTTPGLASVRLGDDVVVVGRAKRRFHRSGPALSSRVDLLVERIVRVRDRRGVDRAERTAHAALELLFAPGDESTKKERDAAATT